ncbi:l-tryptophan--pyruvate aminotransferase 1 [Phtheirospermum japonicum]|uniref:L-tryptophan--pyruvate aminotransferase 1 n=1 Tax=Phtheirospermum japonicum TaxID=374723 RepID=A0A830CJM9_9LAMI|nr:l-tryptophan--pyruvate aminotransferase 1 [Phtheirospermum japonicum]
MVSQCQILGSKNSQSVHENGSTGKHHPQVLINLDHGDPTMYEEYWKKIGDHSVTIAGYQSLSYFSNKTNLCWFLEPKLEEEIKSIHNLVGNAIVEDRHIVVGTGSSQLIQAALYALSDPLNEPDHPVSVVSAAPYYSAYQEIADLLRSRLYKWGGDANSFDAKDEPYIEMVTSPNNPDGAVRKPVVNGTKGILIHDLAYYWPHYDAVTAPADHDIMLFTLSKFTGHAGSRIGWALVRDKEVAKKMVKFIEVNTIGVSKEAQLRAANTLHTISGSCRKDKPDSEIENFFKYSKHVMAERWNRLRDVVKKNELFYVAKSPIQYCNFTRELTEAYPAFAWMKCKDGVDCEKLFKEHKIQTRSGRRFGSGQDYVRISMLNGNEEFDLFLQRLATINNISK